MSGKKGYWIASVEINNEAGFADYVARVGPVLQDFGARTIVRNGRKSVPEQPDDTHHVIVEFESYEAALDCYNSPQYKQMLALRNACSTARFVIIEGS